MSLDIDVSSIDFNTSPTGFTSQYLVPTADEQPPSCVLPSLPPSLTLPSEPLTAPLGGCKFNFNAVFPIPPPVIPKTPIPRVTCPDGISITSDVIIEGSGGITATGGISVINEGCNFFIGGLINIDTPVPPCPEGTFFTGQANITTSGIAAGGGNISVVGGPCNFAIVGNIDIYVPPVDIGGGGGGTAGDCSTGDGLSTGDPLPLDSDGNPIIPPTCGSCDDSDASSPFKLVTPTFGDINFKTATTASCCMVTNDSILDLCGGVLTLSDASGHTNQLEATSIGISGDATITIDASAVGGNNVSFQLINVCSAGSPKQMYVLASTAF